MTISISPPQINIGVVEMELIRSDDSLRLLKEAHDNKGGNKKTTSMMVPETYKAFVENVSSELGISQGLVWRMIVDEWIDCKMKELQS